MRIESIADIAATVRGRRSDLGLTQTDLALRAGVSRKWISEFEAGKPTAQLLLILRVMEALGLQVTIAGRQAEPSSVDLDALIEEHRHG